MTATTRPKKITYTAIAPDGSTHTRKSHRIYTHAALVFGQTSRQERENLPATWGPVSFNSREDLAAKEAAKWAGIYERAIVVPVSARP